MNNTEFAVIGGDMRQEKLAELLSADGHTVKAFALGRTEIKGVQSAKSITSAVSNAKCVILPLPAARDGKLNAPMCYSEYGIDEVLSTLRADQLVTAGRIDEDTYNAAKRHGLSLVDYYDREELVVANAVATAEGAIEIAMKETPVTLHRSKCLVIGYGRIGKVLAHRLWAMCADVTVSARSCADLAWIDAYGYKGLEKLDGKLGQFDIILNTVPARVLGEERLEEIRDDTLIIDLSSKPGGMDFTAAGNLGRKAIWALSLPGEVAPVTSGLTIKNTIYNIMQERANEIATEEN